MANCSEEFLQTLPFFRFFSKEALQEIAPCFRELRFDFGDVIVEEGAVADAYYIIKNGKARVIKKGSTGDEIPLNVLRAGDGFGEMALLSQGKRTATIRTSSGDLTVLVLKYQDFQQILKKNPHVKEFVDLQNRHRQVENFLYEFAGLKDAPVSALREILNSLVQIHVHGNEVVIREGDPAGPMYIIEEGRMRVFKTDSGIDKNIGFLRSGDFFGELSLLEKRVRAASVQAITDCKLFYLNEQAFDQVISRFPELRKIFDERIAGYRADSEARLPLDFFTENVPAPIKIFDKVSEKDISVDQGTETDLIEQLPKKRKRHFKKFPFVMQIDEMDCGTAALGMICRYFGRKVSLTRIRQLAHTSLDGTSLRAICCAATELGLAARGVRVSHRNLNKMKLPTIIHWEGNHWIVLIEILKKGVRVADPASGIRIIPRDEFDEKWSGYAALFEYTEKFKDAPQSRNSITWLVPFFKRFNTVMLQVLLLACVVSGLQLLLPIFTQVIVDRVIVEKNVSLMNLMITGMFVSMIFMLGTSILQRYILSHIAVQIDAGMLDFLMRKMLALPMSYFSRRRTGDIQRRLDGVRQIRRFVAENGITGLLSIVQLCFIILLMGGYNLTLFFVFFLTTPLYICLMVISAKAIRPIFKELEEGFSRYRSYQVDAIKGIEAVKAASAEGFFRDTMLNEFMTIARKQFRSDFIITSYESVVQAVSFLSQILLLYFGTKLVIKSELTIGGFIAFNALYAMAIIPLNAILKLWDELQLTTVLLDRLNDVFEYEPEQGYDRSRLLAVPTLEGRVELQNVGFRYGGKESPAILSDISLKVQAGKRIAVVGRSGSGKTTLIKCLAGLLEATEGRILFDGIEMKSLNYRDLRRHIGFVLQNNYMFADTIISNIAFGDSEPDFDRVIWAAKIANAHNFITQLPLGYETKIGETGLSLSGGQQQRITIARAFYQNPAILIFDEATSALDTESEKAIQDNLESFLKDRTSFIVAHRLSTIKYADMIIVLEKGRIIEQGSHEELMERRGLYFYLCSRQLNL